MSKNELNGAELSIKTSYITIILNILLSAGKLFAGIFANSSAMISDAVHSASDVFSTIIVIIGVKISNKKADACHRYGHERLESIATLFLSFILGLTGIGIGYNGVLKIISGAATNVAAPGLLALVAAIVSIIIKEWV